jgi:hypothetical protein
MTLTLIGGPRHGKVVELAHDCDFLNAPRLVPVVRSIPLHRSRRRRFIDWSTRRNPVTALTYNDVDIILDIYDARTGHFIRTEDNRERAA